jgi:hypothetical protein
VLGVPLAVTTSENVSVVPARVAGAVNVGDAAVALLRVTAGPAVCVHA